MPVLHIGDIEIVAHAQQLTSPALHIKMQMGKYIMLQLCLWAVAQYLSILMQLMVGTVVQAVRGHQIFRSCAFIKCNRLLFLDD